MKLLLDSNLSHRVAEMLRDAGLDAVHVRDHGLQHDSDAAIMRFARERSLVIVSEDTDFGELLAQQRAAAPSLVLPRTYDPMTLDEQAAVLVTAAGRTLCPLSRTFSARDVRAGGRARRSPPMGRGDDRALRGASCCFAEPGRLRGSAPATARSGLGVGDPAQSASL